MSKFDKLVDKYGASKSTSKKLFDIDPSKNGKYTEWVFKNRYIKSGDKYKLNPEFNESMYLPVKEALSWLENNINNPKIPVEYKNINNFNSVSEFITDIEEERVKQVKLGKDEIELVFDCDKFRVIVPKTYEAAKQYGRGTKWCVTDKSTYEEYTSEGMLYYLMIKGNDRKFGFSIGHDYGQICPETLDDLEFYNNEDDEMYGFQFISFYGQKLWDDFTETITQHFNSNLYKFTIIPELEELCNHMMEIKYTIKEKGVNTCVGVIKMLEDFENIVDKKIKLIYNGK